MSKKKDEEPQMLRLRVLITSPMPHPRMAGTKFEYPDGEEARGWIERGQARIIGDDPAEIEPEPRTRKKATAAKKTAKKRVAPRRRRARSATPVVVTTPRAATETAAATPSATEPEAKVET